MNAYNALYLDDACNLLGSYFDVAVNEYGYSIEEAWERFIISSYSYPFERGMPDVLSGISGGELYARIFDINARSERVFIDKTPEYWLGFSIAYYQWFTSVKFSFISQYTDIDYLLSLYHPYHEMDITSFIIKMNKMINEAKGKTNLQIRRERLSLTRKQLSFESGVSIRTIEQYEQGLKDINNAKAITVLALSKPLFCDSIDLLELTKDSLL